MVRPARAAAMTTWLHSALLGMHEVQRIIKPHHVSLVVATEFDNLPCFRFLFIENKGYPNRKSVTSKAFRADAPLVEVMQHLKLACQAFVAPAKIVPKDQSVSPPSPQSPKTVPPR